MILPWADLSLTVGLIFGGAWMIVNNEWCGLALDDEFDGEDIVG